eukprot:TRINITY_DN16616_c0_g1_i2.p2 TRINITY_DN16616_c0_g1~~TRINITY_DN16616_c0_g1_i2.p2  ORF type:complete len:458 (+),score=113.75 TRINITY_DN16616_c0_g1_i2:42-1415(+)
MALLAELSAAAGRLGCPPADGGERHVRSAAGGGARGRRGGSDAPLWAQRVLRNTAARASARRHVVGPVSPRVTAAPRQRRCRGWYDEGRKMCLMFAGANEDAAALRAASQRSAVAAAHRAVRRPRDTSESPELLEGVDDEGGGGEELQEADGDAEARTPSAAESEPPPASPHSAAVVQTVDAWVSSLEGSAEVPPGSAVRLAVLREELFSVLEQEAESRADREELASELSAVQRRLAGVVRERERGIAQQLFSGRRPRVRRPSSVGRASAAASALEQSAARTDAQSRAAKSTIAPSAHPAAAEPPPEAAKEAGEKKEEEAGREDKKKDGGKPRWQAARPLRSRGHHVRIPPRRPAGGRHVCGPVGGAPPDAPRRTAGHSRPHLQTCDIGVGEGVPRDPGRVQQDPPPAVHERSEVEGAGAAEGQPEGKGGTGREGGSDQDGVRRVHTRHQRALQEDR